jgi:hypothetical protein
LTAKGRFQEVQRRRVSVYVTPGCIGCDWTFILVDRIESRMGVTDLVEVIDLSDDDAEAPADLFAVPTWYVDGVRFSLGNPDEEELFERLGSVDSGNDASDATA